MVRGKDKHTPTTRKSHLTRQSTLVEVTPIQLLSPDDFTSPTSTRAKASVSQPQPQPQQSTATATVTATISHNFPTRTADLLPNPVNSRISNKPLAVPLTATSVKTPAPSSALVPFLSSVPSPLVSPPSLDLPQHDLRVANSYYTRAATLFQANKRRAECVAGGEAKPRETVHPSSRLDRLQSSALPLPSAGHRRLQQLIDQRRFRDRGEVHDPWYRASPNPILDRSPPPLHFRLNRDSRNDLHHLWLMSEVPPDLTGAAKSPPPPSPLPLSPQPPQPPQPPPPPHPQPPQPQPPPPPQSTRHGELDSIISPPSAFSKPEEVITKRLHRGTVTTTSPNRSESTPRSWSSFDAMSSRSSDSKSHTRSPMQSFRNIGVVELLEQDWRPTMVVDLAPPALTPPVHASSISVLYANAALRASEGLLESLTVVQSDDLEVVAQLREFCAWATASPVKSRDAIDTPLSPTHDFSGLRWSASTLRSRFRVLSGHAIDMSFVGTPPSDESGDMRAPHGSRPTPESFNSTDTVSSVDTADSTETVTNLPLGALDLANSPIPSDMAEPGYFDTEPVSLPPPFVSDREVGPSVHDFSLEMLNSKIMLTEKPSFDWTKVPVTDEMPDHFKFARSVDWGATPLGPIEDWPDDLRVATNIAMASPHPVAMYWGPEYVAIYNEAYVDLAAKKHPQLMGQRYQDAWAEIWDEIEPIFAEACRSGVATMKHEDRLFVSRSDFLEEAWFSWSIVPIVGSDGTIAGLLNPSFEDTRRKMTERRINLLREVDVEVAPARSLKRFWSLVAKAFSHNEVDVPLALIYAAGDCDDSTSENSFTRSLPGVSLPVMNLEATIGVKVGHPAAPETLDPTDSDVGFAPAMRMAATTGKPVVLRVEDGTMPPSLAEGIEWKGYGEPSRAIVVFPVRPTTGPSQAVGFIVLGTNPRRPFTSEHELFLELLSRQLDTAAASIILFEDEVKRGQRAARLAALDRQELQKLLHARTQEAEESEYRFTRMAEFAPVGMFIANIEGELNYCNDAWWELSRHPRSKVNIHAWMQSIHSDDQAGVQAVWQKLVKERVSVSHEFRFRHTKELNGHVIPAWVLLSVFPEHDDPITGTPSIFGCLTDITQQKWAENIQIQRREEAFEMKRQQENFIDMTSHEMRNPLSAILQCSDEISSLLTNIRGSRESVGSFDSTISNCIEATATVALCAGHQKRIVDDILTLSKLDSQLLLVTPVDVQPISVVEQALKMFEPEFKSKGIEAKFVVEDSYAELAVDWVKLDPSRLLQVLINLMSNAIKFTHNEFDLNRVTISLGASRTLPESTLMGHPSPAIAGMRSSADSSMLSLAEGSVAPTASMATVVSSQFTLSRTQSSGKKSDTSSTNEVLYFPRRDERPASAIVQGEDWGDGDVINLHFSVADTGEGFAENEIKHLFQRFSQATPRTHIKYGGSGLGLFISRMLTELQGGQIGVSSVKGAGSTFKFYIKGRKSFPSADGTIEESTHRVLETVTAEKPEDAKAILAGSILQQPRMTPTPRHTSLQRTKTAASPVKLRVVPLPKPPTLRSTSTPSHDAETGSLERPDCLSPPLTIMESDSLNAYEDSTLVPTNKTEKPDSSRQMHPNDDNASGVKAASSPESKVIGPQVAPKTDSVSLATRAKKVAQRASSIPKASVPRDILVVEDNLVNQKVLQRQLKTAGHSVQVANHGGEALQIIMRSKFWAGPTPSTPMGPTTPLTSRAVSLGKEPNPFERLAPTPPRQPAQAHLAVNVTSPSDTDDAKRPNISIILMDLEMPIMDGITCTRRIRQLEAAGQITSHIPIVAVTAYARPEQISQAKEAGVDDLISKPFRISELEPKMEENIARWKDDKG